MADRYTASRWKRQRKGFRAKLSAGWFVWDRQAGHRFPIAGPFGNRAAATAHIKGIRMKDQDQAATEDTTVKETTQREVHTKTSDPSDSASAKDTATGSQGEADDNERVVGDSGDSKGE